MSPLSPSHEASRLEDVASWYSTAEGFYGRLVGYGFRSIQPFLGGGRGLELGPADGQMTELLLGAFDQLVSVDGSPTFCDTLRARFAGRQGFTVVCSLFEELSLAAEFDTIVATHVLEHLDDPVGVLRRARQWLRPGGDGRLVVLVPNATSIHRQVAVKMGLLPTCDSLNELDVRLGHRRVYTLDGLCADLEAGGWEVEHTGGVFFKPLSNGQIDEWFSTEMMDGFFELGRDLPELSSEVFAVCRVREGESC